MSEFSPSLADESAKIVAAIFDHVGTPEIAIADDAAANDGDSIFDAEHHGDVGSYVAARHAEGIEVQTFLDDRDRTLRGFVLVYPGGSVTSAAAALKPDFTLYSVDGTALVYLADGDGAAIENVARVLHDDAGDEYRVAFVVPLPGLAWALGGAREGKRYTVAEIGAAFYPDGLGLDAEPTSRINDAEIYGTMSAELANLPIMVSSGKSQFEKEWTTQKVSPFSTFFEKVLSRHTVGKKDGAAFVTGSLGKSKRRTKTNVLANYLMGLDVDSGAPMQATFDRVRAMGLAAIFYTTHSHLSTRVEITNDKFIMWAEKNDLDTEPTNELIRRYLREEGKYVTDVCDTAELVDRVHEDGIKLIVQTRPIDKFRVVFPLSEPYVYAKQNSSHKEAIAAWSSRVLGMGRSIGVEADRAARDPSRLFYLPRHSKGANNHRIMLTCGRLLKFEEIERASLAARTSSDDPFEQAAGAMGGKGRRDTESGFDLNRWAADRADGFDIASVFRDHCDDRIRHEQTSNKLTVECPYDDSHSNPGDPEDKGTFVCSGGEEAESFQFFCSHDGCYGRNRLDFMLKAMQEGWFPDSVLTDDRYDLIDRSDEGNDDARSPFTVSLADDGAIQFAKDSRFAIEEHEGRPWVWYEHKAKKDDDEDSEPVWLPVCARFKVLSTAVDVHGGNATITIAYDTRHDGPRELTFAKAEIYDRTTLLQRLASNLFPMDAEPGVAALFKLLDFPIDTLLVDRTGWHDGTFLHPGGLTVPLSSDDGARKKLRLRGGAPAGDWRGGTLEGWKACAAAAFDDDARGREQFALGVMAGGAGIVAGFIGMPGFPILNLHGNTSRGKSSALKLAASVAGAPNERGSYQSLRKTDNGMEGILSARSGITLAIDEGKTTNAETLDNIVWMMAHGAGKTRGTVTGEARVGKEFNGFAMTANEIPLAQMLAAGRKSQPGGFYARVCDVDVSSVPELVGDARNRLFAAVPEKAGAGENIYHHYGHAWEPIARHLRVLGAEHVASEIDRLATELAGVDANSLTKRSANALALVWYSGIVMRELGLIPACDVERVVRWAWGTRTSESTIDPFTRAMETLLTNVALRRGVDIYEWDELQTTTTIKLDDGSTETVVQKRQRYREAAGFIYMSGLEEVLLIPRDKLAELCGGHMSADTIRNQMNARGILVLSGKSSPKPRWSRLPDEQTVPHYRVKLDKLRELFGE